MAHTRKESKAQEARNRIGGFGRVSHDIYYVIASTDLADESGSTFRIRPADAMRLAVSVASMLDQNP